MSTTTTAVIAVAALGVGWLLFRPKKAAGAAPALCVNDPSGTGYRLCVSRPLSPEDGARLVIVATHPQTSPSDRQAIVTALRQDGYPNAADSIEEALTGISGVQWITP